MSRRKLRFSDDELRKIITPFKEQIAEKEKIIIMDAIYCTGGNIQQSSRLLQISRATLNKRIKKYMLNVEDYR